MERKFETQFRQALRAGVPILAVATADQPATCAEIARICNGKRPLLAWDIIRGLLPINDAGAQTLAAILQGDDPAISTLNPAEMLGRINSPSAARAVIVMSNSQNFYSDVTVRQGIANVRNPYKAQGAMLVLLGPSHSLPVELSQDVMSINDDLPTVDQIREIVTSTTTDAGIADVPDIDAVCDTLLGLSGFAAEQTLATCIIKDKDDTITIDKEALWARKCSAVEQTPGLKIGRYNEALTGYDNIRGFLARYVASPKTRPRGIVLIDEIEKMFAGAESDSSGVSQDQLGLILQTMEDNQYDGLIFYGVQGSGKTATAKEAASLANVPFVQFDSGAMKSRYVGDSESQARAAWNTIQAVTQGRALIIATCNGIANLPPELRRRFTLGIFFFDLPSETELAAIWGVHEARYDVTAGDRPVSTGWTGAEVRNCCSIASRLGLSKVEAAQYIVPVSVSARERIENMRISAEGRFISASLPGTYTRAVATAPGRGKRAINFDA